MEKFSSLEDLLRIPGYNGSVILDISVLSCGCLTSESIFNELNIPRICPTCQLQNVSILAPVKPLRDLYNIISNQQSQTSLERRRPSSSKKSIKAILDENYKPKTGDETAGNTESMSLLSLFYKFAKEEQFERTDLKEVPHSYQQQLQQMKDNQVPIQNMLQKQQLNYSDISKTLPIDISSKKANVDLTRSYPSSVLMNSTSISPQNHRAFVEPAVSGIARTNTETDFNNSTDNNIIPSSFEKNLLESLSENKEFNFAKCFPFHRKLSTFPTQQLKLNLSSIVPFKLSNYSIKRATSTSIHSYLDYNSSMEITRFVLISNKRWEVYEYIVPMGDTGNLLIKPQLICCGKLTGEYGENLNSLSLPESDSDEPKEIIVRNDFGAKDNTNCTNDLDIKKRLSSWDQMYCKLTRNYLVISGTKGVMRIFNLNKMSPYKFGQPMYTFVTNFPIRCISIAPNDSLVACGITAKERISGKEQPFVILHRLMMLEYGSLESVDPLTITIPYRDPIKIMNFNASSTHLIIATSWETRYLIIRLTNNRQNDNYRKPRLVWSEIVYKSNRRFKSDFDDENLAGAIYEERAEAENDLMLSKEGITDVKFGTMNSNLIIVTSCSLRSRPPLVIKLEGSQIDSTKNVVNNNDMKSLNSADESEKYSSVESAETFMRINEIGSLIHRIAVSPRGDGIVFLDKDGKLFLVASANFYPGRRISSTDSKNKKIVVQLGDVANAERFSESASVVFSADGGKVFALDRKGVFSVFDFTKGIPGEDPDVIKCKIISL